ncbi:MAG: DUF2852 domain-containing protein [Hyphomicrobiaceae bacterium]|nr:MAG: DUF2852 domain-containing protein [Hyphomicrobiaceae bacterium]
MYHLVLKLDDWGRAAWIALMVVSFIVFWPLGLAVLAFMIWSGRMGCGWRRSWSEEHKARFHERWGRFREAATASHGVFHSSGNRAFDEYRQETLSRLEQEAREFKEFLERLRQAKDKQEFDQFMADRRNRPADPMPPPPPTDRPPSV